MSTEISLARTGAARGLNFNLSFWAAGAPAVSVRGQSALWSP